MAGRFLKIILLTTVEKKINHISKTKNRTKKTLAYKNLIQIIAHLLFFEEKKITKSDYISKTKNRTKKIIYAKKIEFLGAQNSPFGRTPTASKHAHTSPKKFNSLRKWPNLQGNR